MKVEKLGAGEILLTSMDCDGTKAGYDLELTRQIAENVSIPVIASGGAGTKEHFYEALTEGKADAALAASLFHYKELEIMDLKNYLAGRGVSVRGDKTMAMITNDWLTVYLPSLKKPYYRDLYDFVKRITAPM